MIHEKAIIDSEARIGSNVEIGPFCYIEKDVEIGDDCVLGPNVTVLKHSSIGDGCKLHSGSVIGDLPQDTGFKNDVSYVKIGRECVIREGVTIHRGTKPETATEIGDNCFLMAFSHYAHNVKLEPGVIVANGALLAGYVEVGAKAFISGNVVIHQFVRIGRLAMLGGGAGISKDVPPFCLLEPVALNSVAGLNAVGMKRAGISPEERKQIKDAFKKIYTSGLNVSQAAKDIASSFKDGPALEFCEFIAASERGICPMG